eukprot:EST41607.1 Cysteine-rich membrane protein 1 [Spironucleus salmonicida]
MTTTGTCTRTNKKCKAGHFCPANSVTAVNCIPCENDMKFGQGCYCVDDTVITNCKTCSGDNCATCLPGSFLNSNVCSNCPKGCDKCAETNSCQICAAGFIMEGVKCVRVCGSNKDCDYEDQLFCDISSKRCVKCSDKCQICSSATFCNVCVAGTYVTTIDGRCTAACDGIKDGNYCKDGVATPCGAGIDSACKCGKAFNCASCNSASNACETCFPNFVKGNGGTCNFCISRSNPTDNKCQPEEKESEATKIGAGAVVCIVLGGLVVVGGVVDGLAYYFVRKGKK